MAEPITTQPKSSNCVELNDRRSSEQGEEKDNCCNSILRCYCLQNLCKQRSQFRSRNVQRNDNGVVVSSIKSERHSGIIYDSFIDNDDYLNNDNISTNAECNNDFGTFTFDAGSDGRNDFENKLSSDDRFYPNGDHGLDSSNHNVDVFGSNKPEEYVSVNHNYCTYKNDDQTNDNNFSSATCDDNDFGASTYDGGGDDFGGCTSDY